MRQEVLGPIAHRLSKVEDKLPALQMQAPTLQHPELWAGVLCTKSDVA